MTGRGSLYEAAGYGPARGPGGWIRRVLFGLREGARYRGGGGMWAWALHRAAGLGILLFLALHIVDIFLVSFGPELFNELLVFYSAPWARVLEVFLLFGVLFHALNGLRITVQDFLPRTWPAERWLLWAETVVFVPVFAYGAFVFLRPLFE